MLTRPSFFLRNRVVNNDGDYYNNYGEEREPYKYNPDDFAVDDGRWDDVFQGHRSNIDKDIEGLSRNHEDYGAPTGQDGAGGGNGGGGGGGSGRRT